MAGLYRPRQRLFLTSCVFLATLLLPGGSLAGPVHLTGDDGQAVQLVNPARRVVSLAPHLTELLFAVGAGNRVVGVSQYSDFPTAAAGVPRIGDASRVDLERVLALRPDLVVAWRSGNPGAAVQHLRQLGLPVHVSEPATLASIPALMRTLGQLTGCAGSAEKVASAFAKRLEALRRRYAGKPRVRVFYQLWDQPLMTVSGRHIITDVLELCGGANVFASAHGLVPRVSQEAVLQADPQVIIAPLAGFRGIRVLDIWQPWRDMTAVRVGNLMGVDADLLSRATPRLLDAAEQICQGLDRSRKRQATE